MTPRGRGFRAAVPHEPRTADTRAPALFTWPLVLLVGRTIVVFGTQTALTTVLLLSLQDRGASGVYLSGVLLAISLPLMLVAPLAGSLADRVSGRTLIATGAGVQVLAVGAQLLDPPDAMVIVLVAVFATGMAVVAASLQVELPTLVPVELLGRATGWASAAQTTAFMTGPMLAATIYDAGGHRQVLTVVAIGATVIALSALSPPPRPRPGALPPAPAPETKEARQVRSRWFGGMWLVDRVSLVVILYTGALALMLHPTAVIEVLLVRESLGASAATLGLVGAGWSVGMVFGSIVAGRLRITTRGLTRWLILAGAVQAAFLGAAGLAHAPWLFIAFYVVGGFWCGGTNVARQTLLTVRAPEGKRGRALALVVAVHNGVQALGLGLGGVVAELYDPRLGYLLCGAMGVVVSVAFLPWLRSAVHHAAEPAPVEAREARPSSAG